MADFADEFAASRAGADTSALPFEDQFASFRQSQSQEQGRLRASVSVAAETTPQQAAKQKYLSTVTGMPLDVVKSNEGQVKAMAKYQELSDLSATSPVLRAKLQNPEFAALAQDDGKPLSSIEALLGSFGGGVTGTFIGGTLSGFGRLYDMSARAIAAPLIAVGGDRVRDFLQTPIPSVLDPSEMLLKRPGRAFKDIGKMMEPAPDQRNFGTDVAGGLGQIAGQIGTALATGGAGSFAQLFAQGTDAMGEKVDKDNTSQANKDMATMMGASVTALTEKYALDKILGPLAVPVKNAIAAAVARVGVAAITEGGQEIAENIGQDVVRKLITNPDAKIDLPGAAYEGGVGATVGGIVRSLVEAALHVKARGHQREVERAQGEIATLQNIMQTAAGTGLFIHDNATLAEFVQTAAEKTEGAPTSVFVDGKVLADTLAQSGFDDAQIERLLPSVPSQLADAIIDNSPVEIPIGELTVALPGTALEQALVPNLRIRADSLSLNEAKQEQEQAQEFLNQEAERIIAQAGDTVRAAAGTEAVRQLIRDQLNGTGRFSNDVNDKGAKLVANFYTVMAERLKTTPEKLYANLLQYKVKGQGQGALDQESAQFKTFFGKSQIVDDSGKARVMYHATNGDFSVFRQSHRGAYFVTPEVEFANDFLDNSGSTEFEEGANIMPVYVRAENPFDYENPEHVAKVIEYLQKTGLFRGVQPGFFEGGRWDSIEDRAVQKAIKALGFDSFYVFEGGVKNLGVYEASQIKSATGNSGEYDRNSSNILEQVSKEQRRLRQAVDLALIGLPVNGENNGRSEQGRDGSGRAGAGNLAPLEGAPSVPGFQGPDPRLVAVAEQYAADNGIELKRQAEYAQVDPERATRIAVAYEAMQHAPQDPAVREAYENLIRQTLAQYRALEAAGYKFWFIDLNNPANAQYASSPWNAMRDIRANQQMGVFPTNDGFGSSQDFSPEANPLLADTGILWPVGGPEGPLQPVLANDLFRAVHDAFGHGLEGAGFRAQGEENAWQAHVRLFTGSAVGAITSETRGQNSWLNYGPYGEQNRNAKIEDTVFADQKTGLMPEWTWSEGRVGDYAPDTLEQKAVTSEVALPTLLTPNSAIEIRSGAPLTGGQAMTVAQVGAYFDTLTGARDPNDLVEFARALSTLVAEVNFQLEQEKSGLDWYEEDIGTAFAETQKLIPELSDPGQRQLFSVIAGILSPQTNARDNWFIAAKAFRNYKETGTVPGRNPETGALWQGGTTSVNKEKALKMLDAMIQDIGEPAAIEWLMSEHTVKELNEARKKWGNMGPGVDGKMSDTAMGLRAFGPKVGPFVMNINGIHDITVDMWATRTFNRYFGQMIGPDGKIVDAPTEPQRRIIKDLFNEAAKELGIKGYQVQSVIWFFEQQLFNQLGTGAQSYGFSDGARRFTGDSGSDARALADGQGAGRDAQAAEVLNQAGVDLTGVHFSKQSRPVLNGAMYGTGLKGMEADRVLRSQDTRLRSRVYFYVDEGKGVRPEGGVGGAAHEVDLTNMYDAKADPLKLWRGDLNDIESRILDAGFNGYYIRDAFNQQGAAVVLGEAAKAIPTRVIANPATNAPALPEPPQPYKRALLSRELNKLDLAAIQAAAPSARVNGGTFSVDIEQLAAAQAVAKEQGVELPGDTLNQSARGTYDIGSMTTVLNGNADLSTFLHETGHFFLDAIRRMALSEDATPEIIEMYQASLKGLGVTEQQWSDWHVEYERTGKISEGLRKAHEKWAETFEAYLFTGKAPSVEMRGLFRTFAAWLNRVYKSLQEFTARTGTALDPDLKAVMDKMLATDEQIAEAEQAAGMLPDLDATGEAREKLNARSLRDLKWAINARNRMIAKLQKEASEKRKEVEAEVRAEVERMPVYRAEVLLRYGRLPDGDLTNQQRKAMDSAAGMKIKLGLPQLKQMYGEGPAALWRYLATGKNGLAASEGVHPDLLADGLGFESGDALVRALLSAEPMSSVIEGMTDQRMLERYGDLATPEAIQQAATEAVHNEARAKSLATELAAQREMLGARADTGEKTASGARRTVNVLAAAAKQFAQNVIGRRRIKDLKKAAYGHLQAERRAAKAWAAATAKGDTKAAVEAKQDQMLNNAAVRAAQDAQEQVRKAIELFKRVTKGTDEKLVERGYDPDVANAARAILAAYGIAPAKGKSATEYLEALRKNDAATYGAVEPSVTAALINAKPFDELTVEELQALTDEIASLWHLAKRSRQMEVDGNLLDREEVEGELKDDLEARGIPDTMPGDSSAITPREQALRKLTTFRAAAQRLENWAQGMGTNFTKFVFQPVKEAADRYRADKTKYLKAYRALLESVAPTMRKQTIAAPELGYTFGKDTGGVAMSEILHALIHTGNSSNKRKLLLGRGWATENADGTLDTSRWDAFIARMIDEGVLTKVHYDFAQGVWDLLESTKPLAQKTHRDVFGRYFAEVTAEPFETPFGSYRGGYAPAIADSRIVSDAATRELAETENQSMAYAFPTTNRGFTKGRVEYNRPLMLDLRTLAQHIDKVLLFSHLESPVRDVRRVLTAKGVAYGLNRIDPAAFDNIITPWLNRAARQIVETPVAGDAGLMRLLSAARNRAGMAAMFANVANAAQQVTGFSIAAVKVKPSHLMSAMAQMIASPKEMINAVAESSIYMKERLENETANAEAAMREILLDPNLYEKGKAWTAKHAYFLQQAVDNTMSPVIWSAAYNQAIEQGQSEKDAVRFADSVIRTTQGSTLPEDVSRIESGNAFVRLFTQFAGYFNMQANLLGTEFAKVAREVGVRKGAGKMLYITVLGFLAPTWVAEAIMQGLRGGPDDEDKDGEYLDDWLAAVFGWSTLRGVTAMIPGGGQLINSAVNSFNGKPYDDRIASSPAISMIEATVRAPYSVYKAIADEGNRQKAVRDVATAISIASGLPASAVAKPLGYMAGVNQGEIFPTSAADAARGAITGVASPASK